MSGAQICCFAAAVLLLLMRWLSGPAEKLPLRVAEGMTKGGGCVRPLVARPGVCGAFKRACCEGRTVVTFECIDV